jgi:restriction system protein
MLGFGPLGSSALGEISEEYKIIGASSDIVSLALMGIVIPEAKVDAGILIKSISSVWIEMARTLGNDWSQAFKLSPTQWEEMIAGAYRQQGYEEVIVTPRSGDHGRDVIAIKKGVGTVKIINSMKAYAAHRKVGYDDIRALLGVMSGEPDISKGMLSTTASFPKNVELQPEIKRFMPTCLELMDGPRLQAWLKELAEKRA